MMAEVRQFELPMVPVDSTLQFTDLSKEPVIESEPVQALVSVPIHVGFAL